MRRYLLAGLLWMLGQSTPGLAGLPLDNPVEGAAKPSPVVVIPFAPPVDKDLAYAVRIIKSQNGTTKLATFEERLRFTPSENGYFLTITMVSGAIPGLEIINMEAAPPAVSPQLKALLAPISFDVARDGSIVRVRDWEGVKKRYAAIPDIMVSVQGTDARQIANNVIRPYLSASAEQAVPLLLKAWPQITGFGGSELEPGVEYSQNIETSSPLLPITIPTTVRTSLAEDSTDRALHIVVDSTPDQTATSKAIAGFVTGLGTNLPPQQQANVAKAVELMKKMNITDHHDILFDRVTGLVLRATLQRTVKIEGMGSGGERVEIDLHE